MIIGVGMPCSGVCIYVPCDYVVGECVEVMKSVGDISVFCCVIWVCGLSWWYVNVRYV